MSREGTSTPRLQRRKRSERSSQVARELIIVAALWTSLFHGLVSRCCLWVLSQYDSVDAPQLLSFTDLKYTLKRNCMSLPFSL